MDVYQRLDLLACAVGFGRALRVFDGLTTVTLTCSSNASSARISFVWSNVLHLSFLDGPVLSAGIGNFAFALNLVLFL